MSGPTTEAGKRLLADLLDQLEFRSQREDVRAHIAAIEAEARNDWAGVSLEQGRREGVAAERARIAEAVMALPKWDKRTVPGGFHVNRAAVLAIVEEPE